jgi:fatty-acyl-CoA synthase
VWAPNVPEWVLLYYGVALAGMTLVTINRAYRREELTFVLRRSGAKAVFLLPEYRGNPMSESLATARPHLPELADAWLLTDFAGLLATPDGM